MTSHCITHQHGGHACGTLATRGAAGSKRCSQALFAVFLVAGSLVCASLATAMTPAQREAQVLERVEDKWDPAMKGYVSGSDETGYALDWEGFKGSLPERLQRHYNKIDKLPPTDLDVQAINYLRRAIVVMNKQRPRMLRETAAASPAVSAARVANASLFPRACWVIGHNDSYTSIEVKATGTCANNALRAMKGCNSLPYPFSSVSKLSICKLANKAQEHMTKCGYQGFKIKFYPLRFKFNVGC